MGRRLVSTLAGTTLLLLSAGFAPLAAQTAVTIDVDVAANRRAIDPRIYGLAFADGAELSAARAPLNRWGGNASTRYNWRLNADNRAADWYFESIGYDSADEGAEADAFVSASRSGGAEPMLTVPMIGWLARLGPARGKLASFSIAKYGAQTDADWSWMPDAGNGILAATGQPIAGNDKTDANEEHDAAYQRDWVSHLVGRWGAAGAGGVRYYFLDNEHTIWFSTHRDVWPVGATMDEIRERMIDYATRIKEADPGARVLGPEEWGWSAYFYSGYDAWYADQNGWGVFPDREAHGDWDYLPWLLDQLRQHEATTGQRLLDAFTVHYYPQEGEYGSDTSSAMQLRRNRSTRSLWDPSYTDTSWIGDTVRLIPRLRQWVDAYYPGTEIGITEYNWGAEGHINGATTQADILGIFGREGLDLATRWTTPAASTPTFKAIQMYRNYDGAGAAFGDVSVSAGGPNPDQVSVFAAQRSSDQALTLMVINKVPGTPYDATIDVGHFVARGSAEVWRLTSANAIGRSADAAVTSGRLTASLPAQSITLFVLAAAGGPSLSVGDVEVTEGDSEPAAAVFDVTLSEAAATGVTVQYATRADTAATGSDFSATSGTLTFAAGETAHTVTVDVLGDLLDEEDDETFELVLTVPGGATLADATGIATIHDNDPLPTLSIADASVTEGHSGPTSLSLPVSLSAASGRVVTVGYATSDGTASAGSDYAARSGTLTVAAGATSAAVAVPVTGDVRDEDDETFSVTLSAPTHAELADAVAVATIVDDDQTPGLSVSDVRVTEATGVGVTAAVTVSLSTPSPLRVTVRYATVPGSAVSPADFVAGAGTLTFAVGRLSQVVRVPVIGDASDEPDETFTVHLSAALNATLADADGVVTILDNDLPPLVRVANANVGEGQPGATRALRFVVSLSTVSGYPVTANYATSDGTALSAVDYTALAGVLTFPPGTRTQVVSVPVLADLLDEPNEKLGLTLSAPTNATLADGEAVGTVLDDDASPRLSVGDASVTEGEAGAAGNLQFAVRLSAASGYPVGVRYATTNGTARAGSDYTATAGLLTFGPGEVTRSVDVPVLGDALDEPDERLRLVLSLPQHATLEDAVGLGTIVDDDPAAAAAVQ